MGKLTASLAHELNQPLTAIASNAAASRRFLAKGFSRSQKVREILAAVFPDARRAGEVIHGIHRFGARTKGTGAPLLHSDLFGRAATVETALAASLSTVEADPVRL